MAGNFPGTDPNEWIPKCKGRTMSGKPCGRTALKGKEKCRLHSGMRKKEQEMREEIKNSNNPYIRALKDHPLAARIEEAENDESLISFTKELQLSEGLIKELLSRFEAGDAEGMGTVKKVKKIYKDMVEAGSVKKDKLLFSHLVVELGEALDAAEHQFALIEELKSAVRLKKDLLDSHTKREFQMSQMIRAAEVRDLLIQLSIANQGVIYDRIKDPELARQILADIDNEFERLVGSGYSGRTYQTLPEG